RQLFGAGVHVAVRRWIIGDGWINIEAIDRGFRICGPFLNRQLTVRCNDCGREIYCARILAAGTAQPCLPIAVIISGCPRSRSRLIWGLSRCRLEQHKTRDQRQSRDDSSVHFRSSLRYAVNASAASCHPLPTASALPALRLPSARALLCDLCPGEQHRPPLCRLYNLDKCRFAPYRVPPAIPNLAGADLIESCHIR